MTTVDTRRCWANRPSTVGAANQCNNRVSNAPDHVGLCDDCRDRLRKAE